MLLIIMLYALWAGSVTASKELLLYTSPMFLTGIRMFLAGLLLLGYQYFHPAKLFRFQWKHLRLYAQIIFFGIFITYNLRFWALSSVSAAKTMFLYNLSPFFSSLYSYFLFNEILTRKQWLGLLVGCVGFIPILMTSSTGEASLGEFFFISWQEAAIMLSVAMHSYSWIIMRKLVKDKNYSPMMVNGICMSAGGLLALVTSFYFDGTFFPVTNVLRFTGLLSFIIIISNIICHNLYGYLLRKYTATFLAFAGFLGPPFAAFYGWFLKNEVVTWHFYVSCIIVFAGLYLFYKDELKKNTNAT